MAAYGIIRLMQRSIADFTKNNEKGQEIMDSVYAAVPNLDEVLGMVEDSGSVSSTGTVPSRMCAEDYEGLAEAPAKAGSSDQTSDGESDSLGDKEGLQELPAHAAGW